MYNASKFKLDPPLYSVAGKRVVRGGGGAACFLYGAVHGSAM